MIDNTTAALVAKAQLDRAQADLTEAVWAMRDEGQSWADVAQVLGTTRQSAWRKYGAGEPLTPCHNHDRVVPTCRACQISNTGPA